MYVTMYVTNTGLNSFAIVWPGTVLVRHLHVGVVQMVPLQLIESKISYLHAEETPQQRSARFSALINTRVRFVWSDLLTHVMVESPKSCSAVQ